jgi:hypothetical protein
LMCGLLTERPRVLGRLLEPEVARLDHHVPELNLKRISVYPESNVLGCWVCVSKDIITSRNHHTSAAMKKDCTCRRLSNISKQGNRQMRAAPVHPSAWLHDNEAHPV